MSNGPDSGLESPALVLGAGNNSEPNFFSLTRFPFGVACFAVAIFGLFLRAPDTLKIPQLIGEDGAVFYIEQANRFLPLVFSPLLGYFAALARLVAWISSCLPALQVPFAYVILSTTINAVSIAYFCCRARGLFDPLVCLAVFLLLPLQNGVILGNISNMQWFTQFVILAACFFPKRESAPGTTVRTMELLLLFLAAWTGPFALLCAALLFLLAFAAVVEHLVLAAGAPRPLSKFLNARDWTSVAIVSIAGLVQLLQALKPTVMHAQPSISLLGDFVNGVTGEGVQEHLFGRAVMLPPVFIFVECLFFLLLLFWKTNACTRIACFLLLGFGWINLAAGYLKMKGYSMPTPEINYIDRYFFSLSVLGWLIAWRVLRDSVHQGTRVATGLTILALLALAFYNPSVVLKRPSAPDLDWPIYAPRIDAGEKIDVPINPRPWHFVVPGKGRP